MFSRSQPREVYRVYGEDDFFAEQEQDAEGYQDYPHSQGDSLEPEPQPPTPFEVPPEPLQHFAPAPEPIQHFAPAPEPAQHFAAPPISQPIEYAPPTQSYEHPAAAVFAGEHRNGQQLEPDMLSTSTGGVYGTGGARRRTGGLILLAGVLGLVLGLLLISSLRGGGASRPSASTPPAQTTPQVRTPAPSRASASAAHSSPAAAVHQQAHSRAHITVIRASRRHVNQRPSAAGTRAAPVRSSGHSSSSQRLNSLAHFRAPAPTSVPTPVSAPAPSYAPPSSAQTGSEFGFEN